MSVNAILPHHDVLERRVLFALELVDAVAQTLVQRGVEVEAVGLQRAPIINHSGRFVWLEEGDRWPTRVNVTTHDVALASHVAPAPPRPVDLTVALPTQRLLRIELRPTPAYAFDSGVTAVRGRLLEDASEDSPPVVGALVQLAWFDADAGEWVPELPAGTGTPDASPREVETDGHGEFGVFLRLNPPRPARPDVVDGLLNARLQVTRGDGGIVSAVTPPDFEFISGKQTGRLPEGRPLDRDLTLIWTQLTKL